MIIETYGKFFSEMFKKVDICEDNILNISSDGITVNRMNTIQSIRVKLIVKNKNFKNINHKNDILPISNMKSFLDLIGSFDDIRIEKIDDKKIILSDEKNVVKFNLADEKTISQDIPNISQLDKEHIIHTKIEKNTIDKIKNILKTLETKISDVRIFNDKNGMLYIEITGDSGIEWKYQIGQTDVTDTIETSILPTVMYEAIKLLTEKEAVFHVGNDIPLKITEDNDLLYFEEYVVCMNKE